MERVLELFELFSRLYTEHVVSTPESLRFTRIDLKLKERHVMARFPKTLIRKIAISAKKGDLKSMSTLSMMYGVGLGVPQDETLSACWAAMSIVEAPFMKLAEIQKLLREHINAMTEEFAYPHYIREAHGHLTVKHRVHDPRKDSLRGLYRVAPVYKGVTLNLAYRFSDRDCYLYDASTSHANLVLIDKLGRLAIPKRFGTINDTMTIPDYRTRAESIAGESIKLLMVSGMLVIPNSVKKYVKASYPDCKTASDLFAAFLADTRPRTAYVDRSLYGEMRDSLNAKRERLMYATTGKLAADLKADYERKRRRYKNTPTPEARAEALAVKEEYQNLVTGKLQPALTQEISMLEHELQFADESVKNSELMHHYSFLENAFVFVASDVYYYHDDTRKTYPLETNFVAHMQSAGFDGTALNEVTRFQIKGSQLDVPALVSEFEHPEYTLNSLVLRPVVRANDTVNKPSLSIKL